MDRPAVPKEKNQIDLVLDQKLLKILRPVSGRTTKIIGFGGIEKPVTAIEIDFKNGGTNAPEILTQVAEKRAYRALQQEHSLIARCDKIKQLPHTFSAVNHDLF
jgi:hypothetical protein